MEPWCPQLQLPSQPGESRSANKSNYRNISRPLADPGRVACPTTTTGLSSSLHQRGENLLGMRPRPAGQPKVGCLPPFSSNLVPKVCMHLRSTAWLFWKAAITHLIPWCREKLRCQSGPNVLLAGAAAPWHTPLTLLSEQTALPAGTG